MKKQGWELLKRDRTREEQKRMARGETLLNGGGKNNWEKRGSGGGRKTGKHGGVAQRIDQKLNIIERRSGPKRKEDEILLLGQGGEKQKIRYLLRRKA